MKKILIFPILCFITSCKNKTENFQSFEVSYTDGWTKRRSFVAFQDSLYEYQINFGERKGGKLDKVDFKNLELILSDLENNNLKSKTDKCVDCPIISINIERDGGPIRLMQKGEIDSQLNDIEKTIDKIIKHENTYFLKPTYFYKTDKDIAPPLPPKI